jgi:hypothetical protein
MRLKFKFHSSEFIILSLQKAVFLHFLNMKLQFLNELRTKMLKGVIKGVTVISKEH